MPFLFYRGDSRPPDTIRADGFKARVELTADQARLLIKKALKTTVANTEFPTNLCESLNAVTIAKLIDLQTFIKYTKNGTTTPQVSTAYDDDCGGQANGKDAKGNPYNIYEITIAALFILDGSGVRPAAAADFPHTAMFPKVLMDTNSLDTATTIGVMMKDEVAFLTSIPTAQITRVKEGGTWKAM